ncbi:MAG: NFACT family protein [Lachnospiraceae bacterium]
MAFDGITVAAVTEELNRTLTGGRIYKIAQPEADELLLTVKTQTGNYRLLMSADASLPLVYLTQANKQGPMTAPNFCMLLRKHLQNARIIGFTQPSMERIIRMELEHYNEMGDLCRKFLVIEIMGKHSNIILLDDNNVILDSIKRISALVSSVREVLPGKPYFIPGAGEKQDPTMVVKADFVAAFSEKHMPVYKAIYGSYTGLSPVVANALCYGAKVEPDMDTQMLSGEQTDDLWEEFSKLTYCLKKQEYHPEVYYENGILKEYAAIPLSGFREKKEYDSISKLLYEFYAQKNLQIRIRQKSGDLRRIVQTAMERNAKKYDLQLAQQKDTEKRETYRIYGELLNTYGYSAPEGACEIEVLNYYTNEMITIPLDENLSATENAKKYFDKYGKLKRTYEAMQQQTEETRRELEYLETVANALDIALKEEDLVPIKEELTESGFIRRKGGAKKPKITSKPFHYVSSDGFHIFVGKNNYQNDELTFQLAGNKDWWFHAKNAPGSHVVVRTEGKELPDRTFEEAASLAAYYSKVSGQDKVEIDYTQRRNVKKPAGAAPGFVVYYTNYSMMARPDIRNLQLLD